MGRKILQKHFKSCQKHAQIGFIPKLGWHLWHFPCQLKNFPVSWNRPFTRGKISQIGKTFPDQVKRLILFQKQSWFHCVHYTRSLPTNQLDFHIWTQFSNTVSIQRAWIGFNLCRCYSTFMNRGTRAHWPQAELRTHERGYFKSSRFYTYDFPGEYFPRKLKSGKTGYLFLRE